MQLKYKNMKKSKPFNESILYVILIVIVIFSIVNLYFVTTRSQAISTSLEKAKEDARPAAIEVIKLTTNCQNCFERGKQLVSDLGITKLPTLIVSGEVKKPSIENIWGAWEEKEGNFVFKDVLPPYTNPESEVVGLVSLVNIVDSSCSKCADLSQVTTFLKESGVVFSDEKSLEYTTTEAQGLIDKFGIEKIPAVVLSDSILEYPSVKEVWDQVGATEKEGYFALHTQFPPYRDVKSNEVKGLVKVNYLSDSSCQTCYDVNVNREILLGFGLALEEENDLDISTTIGSGLVEKYNITKVPIILLSPEAAEYSDLTLVWSSVGDIDADGWYIMRNPELMGNHKDLTTGQEVSVEG